MNYRTRLLAGAIGLAAVCAPATAFASTPDSSAPGSSTPSSSTPDTSTPPTSTPAPATPTTFTLPLFGAQLTVDITSGPGGVLSSVSVNPADGLTATTLKPNKVVFENADGTARVVVKNRNGGQKVEAKAGSLADIAGAGGWSGDIFGDGTITTVGFTVGAAADGSGPDITGITTSDPTAVIGAVQRENDDDDGDEQEAKVRISFTKDGQTRTLTIKVKVENDEGDGEAKVSVSLSKLRGAPQPAVEAAGAKTWTGTLCDGTAATISYAVAEDGSISAVSASPEPDRLKNEGNKLEVRFETGERVKIRVRANDGQLTASVDERIRCEGQTPVVNTPTSGPSSSSPDDDNDDNDGSDDSRGRDEDEDDDDDGDKDDGKDGGKNDDNSGRSGDRGGRDDDKGGDGDD